MSRIKLTNGGYTYVDSSDLKEANKYKWYKVTDHNISYAYTNIKIGGKNTTLKLHRLLMKPSKNNVIDHINRDGLNNRRNNLREVKTGINSYNIKTKKRINNLPQGVSFNKGSSFKYRVRIKYSKIEVSLGTYNNKYTAGMIYKLAFNHRLSMPFLTVDQFKDNMKIILRGAKSE